MYAIWNDLAYALRQLRRSPGFAVTAVLTLALGVGANTAIFSLLDQALLRSLPVRDPQQLVVLEGTGKAWEGHSSSHGQDHEEESFSYPMYRDLRNRNQAFTGLIATAPADIGVVRGSNSQLSRAELVSGNYFQVLGVQPALGRLFTQAEDRTPGDAPVAVLSYDFWKDHLGADPTVVGATVSINAHPFQVVGVAARGFRSAVWGETPGVFVPMAMLNAILPGKAPRLTDHTDRWLNIIGRMKPGVGRAQAEVALAPLWHALRAEELKALGHRSEAFTQEFLTRSRLLLLPGARGFSYSREEYQDPLLAAMSMAGLVLILAAMNVGSLLLVRSAGRMQEFSLRYALGARATRLLAQLLLEGLLIGIAGGTAGILLAPFALHALVRQLLGDESYGAFAATIDGRVLIFNFAVALLASIVFSLAPALDLRRVDLTSSMRKGTGRSAAGLGFRRVLVSVQIGLSVLLLVGAGLFVRTEQKLRSLNVGFTTSHLVTFGIDPALAGYAPTAFPALYDRVAATLAALPGVESVGGSNLAELDGDDAGGNITLAGYTPTAQADSDVVKDFVTPDFFSTMQIPLLAGRFFTSADIAGHPLAAIVNQAFVKHFCGDVNRCVGRRLADGGGDAPINIEIVGVVRDARHADLRTESVPTVYRPLKQATKPTRLYSFLRTTGAPDAMLPTIRRAMQQLAPAIALSALRTMDAQVKDALANERLIAMLAVSFGGLATVLAGVGIYGVLAYATAQRTHEIAIRIALGSSRGAVARTVLFDVLTLAGFGVLGAVPAVFGMSRLVRSQLFGVSATDPLSLVAAALLVAATALLAAFLPARRAASVDPMQALRTE